MKINFSHKALSLLSAALLAGTALFFFASSSPTHAQSAAATFDEKVVYHVDDPANATMALRNIANHLAASPQARIALVANGKAVTMLAGSEYAPQIAELQGRGVRFVACHNSMNAFKIQQSDLVTGVTVVPAGVAELSRLQGAEHYSYIKP